MGPYSAGSVANTYIVRGIPSIWLIGPGGKILAKELRGSAIERAVARAMGANSN